MYKLPNTLSEDIARFDTLAGEYERQELSAADFKAFRVPMGVYEQRKDGSYMARIRTTGGVISPAQLLRVIEIAEAHQSDLLHITTRQEIQIHNLPLREVVPVLRELQAAGLSTKGGGGNTVRNVLVSEGSGIAREETFDTTPHAWALVERLMDEPDSFRLPRKLKIAFSSDSRQIDYAAINDVGLVARLQEGQKGYRVYIGGGAGNRPTIGWLLFDFLPAEEILTLVRAVKRFFAEYGNWKNRNQARIRYIFYKLGEEETLRLVRSFYEEEKEKGVSLPVPAVTEERPVPPFEKQTLSEAEQLRYETWRQRYATPQRQAGYDSVLFPVSFGDIRLGTAAKGLKQLLAWLQALGEDTLRFTTTQNIRLRHIPEEALPSLFFYLKDFPERFFAPIVVNQIVACTGADTCRLGIGLSKGLADAIQAELLRSELPLDRLAGVSLHVTGCPNSCGQQLWANIGFSGKVLRNGGRSYPGYQVYLAANRYQQPRLAEPVGSLAARDVPRFVCRLLGAWLEEAARYPLLNDYLQDAGKAKAEELLAGYKEIPSFEEDPTYYVDWGAEDAFSTGARGKAECAAGPGKIGEELETLRAQGNKERTPVEKAAEQQAGHRVKDLRGVACPMNFVWTKFELSALAPGELLEIWLDEGQPIRNVPASVTAEGHTIVEQKQEAGYWKVIIKK